MNRFHQQKVTIAESLDRHSVLYHRNDCKDMDLTDYKFFYKVSDTCIMMVVRHGSGKNRDKYECAYYNGFMNNDTFVIRDPEPKEAAVWFANNKDFEEFISREGLTEKFSTFRSSDMPERCVDDVIPTLWEDFKDLNKERIKEGCWETAFINVRTGEECSTNGDISKNHTWKDYFVWLISDIETMNVGELKYIRITDVYYNGINNKEATA